MGSELLEGVKSAVPRGFSRYYIIEVLRDGPHTGKEIIDRAAKESGGKWKPSPGLIYPLIGRLVDEGIITDSGGHGNSRYTLTKMGRETADDISKISDGIKKQIEVLSRLRNAGRFAAMDIIEQIAATVEALGSGHSSGNDIQKDTPEYRQFLIDELERLDGKKGASITVTGGTSKKEE